MSPNELERLFEQLKNHPLMSPLVSPKFCDNCGGAHTAADDLVVLTADQGNFVLQLTCPHCSLVQILRLSPNSPVSIQRFEQNNTDIKGPEFQKFAGKSSVDSEEALDVYQQMQKVQNIDDFLRLAK